MNKYTFTYFLISANTVQEASTVIIAKNENIANDLLSKKISEFLKENNYSHHTKIRKYLKKVIKNRYRL